MRKIYLAWWTGMGGKNWGDALSPVLTKYISGGAQIEHVNPIDSSSKFRFYSIGSIIPHLLQTLKYGAQALFST